MDTCTLISKQREEEEETPKCYMQIYQATSPDCELTNSQAKEATPSQPESPVPARSDPRGREEEGSDVRPPARPPSGPGAAGRGWGPRFCRLARLPDAPGAAATPMPGARALSAGNSTFFPFFSEFKGAHRVALTALETAALTLIFLLALAANVCGIALLARRKSRLRASGCLVLNLFCADVLFISVIPVILVVRWTESWTLGEAACHLLFYGMSLSGSVTILSLAAVSLERVVSIVRLRPLRPCRGRVVAAILLLIWAFSALATLPLSLFFTVVPQRVRDQVGEPRRR
ncbi:UNVERIFIED_CONTAM: hypothetical protein K2H54_034123 [Gekko kuhli]